MGDNGPLVEQMDCTMTREDMEVLKRLAQERGTSRRGVIRQLIRAAGDQVKPSIQLPTDQAAWDAVAPQISRALAKHIETTGR